MRIAHVNQDRGVGPQRHKGAAIHLRAMRDAFRREGCEVLSLDLSGATLRKTLANAHLETPIHLIYERYSLNSPSAARFAEEEAIPFVLEVNAPLAEESARWRPANGMNLDLELDSYPFKVASSVICVSRPLAEYSIQRGADPERVIVRANAVDSDRFRPARRNPATHAKIAPPGRFVVGFHGRLRPWHNFGWLARAFSQLVAEDLPVHLLAFGEGPFREELEGVVPESRYTLLGWAEGVELAERVASFDAIALSYAKDAPCYFSPLKLLEAMASGAVPIVPRLGDLELNIGKAGLVYEADDAEGLCSALRSLVTDEARQRILSRNARDWAVGHSWCAIAREALLHARVGGAV